MNLTALPEFGKNIALPEYGGRLYNIYQNIDIQSKNNLNQPGFFVHVWVAGEQVPGGSHRKPKSSALRAHLSKKHVCTFFTCFPLFKLVAQAIQ